jgi:hypothetical protein
MKIESGRTLQEVPSCSVRNQALAPIATTLHRAFGPDALRVEQGVAGQLED